MYDNTIYSDKELKKIQALELQILKEVVLVCDNNDIEYFLIGGTALGAIRHNGFIPWDDDIDIGMTRENYEKFIKIAPGVLSSQYEVQTPNNKYSPYLYTKVRLNDTVFMEYANHNNNRMNHGVYIDIFPFDAVPDDDKKYLKQFKKTMNLIDLWSLRESGSISTPPTNFKQRLKAFMRFFPHILCKIIPRAVIVKKVNRTITKYNGTEQKALSCLFFPIMKTEYIKLENLYPLKRHIFEDLQANIPNEIDAYLTTHYGDYMQLPPIDKRFGHKPYKVEV